MGNDAVTPHPDEAAGKAAGDKAARWPAHLFGWKVAVAPTLQGKNESPYAGLHRPAGKRAKVCVIQTRPVVGQRKQTQVSDSKVQRRKKGKRRGPKKMDTTAFGGGSSAAEIAVFVEAMNAKSLPTGRFAKLEVLTLCRPDDSWRQWWDLIIVMFVLFNTVVVPIDVAWGADKLSEHIEVVNALIDVCFALDICVHMRSAFYDEKEVLITDTREIARHYISSTWFWIDVVSVMPWELAFSFLNTETTKTAFKMAGAIKMLRLLRLTKFFRWLYDNLGDYATAVKVFQLIFMFFLFAHWCGCMLYMFDIVVGGVDVAEVYEGYGEDDFVEVYILSLFKGVMILVGEGVELYTDATRVFACLAMAIACGVNAVIFGMVASLVANKNSMNAVIKAQADMLHDRMKVLHVPLEMQKRLGDFFDFRWNRTFGLHDARLFPDLSATLRLEVALFLHGHLLKRCEILSSITPRMTEHLVLKLERQFYAPGEWVVREGQRGEHMFFIARGIVQVAKRGYSETWLLRDGGSFGDLALMPLGLAIGATYVRNMQHKDDGRRNATVECIDYAELLQLHRTELEEVLRMPEGEATRNKIQRAYLRRSLMLQLMSSENARLRNAFCLWRGIATRLKELKVVRSYVSDSDDEASSQPTTDINTPRIVAVEAGDSGSDEHHELGSQMHTSGAMVHAAGRRMTGPTRPEAHWSETRAADVSKRAKRSSMTVGAIELILPNDLPPKSDDDAVARLCQRFSQLEVEMLDIRHATARMLNQLSLIVTQMETDQPSADPPPIFQPAESPPVLAQEEPMALEPRLEPASK